MKGLRLLGALAITVPLLASAAKYNYETVPGDPLQTKMYTLPNGLKLFMSVNKDQPRIQTYIAVRVGGKNDPAETTGLAHYFDHLMFKGTEQFGTSDYAAEKPLLDRIETLFETYRRTTDSTERARIYREIDSVSYEASKIAIPNEYDKLMSAIGANGTNAYTSYDVTCYVEDIPSNQIDNWAKIQADRFEHPVLRGFHTELETIYEEKNMSLTQDNRKVYEAILSTLFPHHPYGSQTVLGTQENLKNPSITNVKNYHKQWYVPNNMAVCVSGDFDPDEMVDIITKYFGHLKPNKNLPRPALPSEKPFDKPKEVEVMGREAENITLCWRVPEAANDDMTALKVLDNVVCNGKTGLFDLDVTLPQRVLGGGAYILEMADAGAYVMSGRPKADQSLDDVRDILLAEIDKVRKGEFSEELVEAVKANMKLDVQRGLTNNDSRANYYVQAFVNGIPWADEVAQLSEIDKVTKADVVAMANKYLGAQNYAAIYKRQGEDKNELKIAKPAITPIEMNRHLSSDFLKQIQNTPVKPIEPVFADYNKDLTRLKAKNGMEVLYMPNKTNDIFQLVYVYDLGWFADPDLYLAGELMNYVGTSKMSPEEVKNEFYKLACSFFFNVSAERTYAVVTGLSENMDKAVKLFENVLADAVLAPEALNANIARQEKARLDAKHNQRSNFSMLQSYVIYGPQNPSTARPSIEALRATKPEAFAEALRRLNNYEQTAIYWGNAPEKDVVKLINASHPIAKKPIVPSKERKFKPVEPTETVIYIAPYEAKQLYMSGYSNRGELFDPAKQPMLKLYNEYFGGSMNAIVFQEMRESRSLAYSAWAGFSEPSKKDRNYAYMTSIATQNDKLLDAMDAFDEIINQMPRSEAAFELAKAGLDSRCRTERSVNNDLAFEYLADRDLGYDHDPRRELFAILPTANLDQLEAFQKENVKGRIYNIGILGDIKDLPIDELRKRGKVVILTTEDIFGY